MSYRKSDVEFHFKGYSRQAYPAVNVKVYGSPLDVTLPLELSRYSDDGGMTWQTSVTDSRFDREWMEDNVSESQWESAWMFALESGWEFLQTLDEDTWPARYGSTVKVFSEGRSGGWAIVKGIDDFESWDAIALGEWQRFERQAKAIANDIPRAMLELAYVNVFEPWATEQEKDYSMARG
jgi:hypothetical protein